MESSFDAGILSYAMLIDLLQLLTPSIRNGLPGNLVTMLDQ
jgi:hypothetical protein